MLLPSLLCFPGLPGEKGDTGIRGTPGPAGLPGANGLNGDIGTAGLNDRRALDCLSVSLSIFLSPFLQNAAFFKFFVDVIFYALFIKTTTGDKGDQGPVGLPGAPGIPGKSGEKGVVLCQNFTRNCITSPVLITLNQITLKYV